MRRASVQADKAEPPGATHRYCNRNLAPASARAANEHGSGSHPQRSHVLHLAAVAVRRIRRLALSPRFQHRHDGRARGIAHSPPDAGGNGHPRDGGDDFRGQRADHSAHDRLLGAARGDRRLGRLLRRRAPRGDAHRAMGAQLSGRSAAHEPGADRSPELATIPRLVRARYRGSRASSWRGRSRACPGATCSRSSPPWRCSRSCPISRSSYAACGPTTASSFRPRPAAASAR